MRGLRSAILSAIATGVLLSGGARGRGSEQIYSPAVVPAPVSQVEIIDDVIARAGNHGVPEEYARALAAYDCNSGKPFFDSENIIALWDGDANLDATPDTELMIAETRDYGGYRILDGDGVQAIFAQNREVDFYKFWDGHTGKQYYRQLHHLKDHFGLELLTSFDIYRAHILGLEPQDFRRFKDTEKPNALITMPESDYNGAFFGTAYHTFIKSIKQTYDVTFVFSSSEWDIYHNIRVLPPLDLLITSGHGSPTSITLRDSAQDPSGIPSETATLDIDDAEFARYVQRMRPSATIVLYACSTAKEVSVEAASSKIPPPYSENLADTITRLAEPRQVLAAKDLLFSITITSDFPFNGTMNGKDGDNITYCAR